MKVIAPHTGGHLVKQLAKRCLLSTWWLCCVCLAANADAAAQYRFDSWTTDNGLPQASVNSIRQTRDGFLWFTTFGGLVRYDGLRFQVFNTGNTKGLRSSRFVRLFDDRDGNLWITTEAQGLTRYQDESFTTYTTHDGLFDNLVTNVTENAAGTVLLQFSDRLMQWQNGRFMPYAPGPDEWTTGRSHSTRAGALWYLEGSTLRKRAQGKVLVEFTTDFDVRTFYEDRAGRLWIGTAENRLLKYDSGKLTVYSEREGFPPYRVNSFSEDRQNQLWISTRGGGLLLVKDDKIVRYTTADGLAGNDVGQIYQDREGAYWIGTTSGLSRMTERVVQTYSTKDGLAGDNVYPIYEDRQGTIWIGSWKGLTRYANGVFTDVGRQYRVADSQVTTVFVDNAGGLWIGTLGEGVKYARDGKVTDFSRPELGSGTRVIMQDRTGSIWFGTNGLVKYRDGAFTAYTTKDGLSGRPSVIYEDHLGQLWIGTDAGLTKYKDGKFTAYTETDGVATNIMRSVYEDKDGVLWIGTYDAGLYRLKDGRVTHYTNREGLFDNGVFQIIEDGRGYFWISCNIGIYRVRKADLNELAEGRANQFSSIPYTKRDGMLNAECNGGGQSAGIRARDGRLWFPTQGGVAVINPEAVPYNQQPPQVVIESLNIDTAPVSARLPVRIEPGQVNVEIHYSGLSFINPELVKFKYRLADLDANWIDANTRRTAYYSHLPPGKYRFTVLAANRDGVWNNQGASIEITVLPPFWRTWWFVTLTVLALAGIALAFYRHRIGILKNAHATQEAFSQQLIESQEEERRRIAVELHDSLGQSLVLIRNWALLGLKASEEQAPARGNLQEISTTASEAINEVRQIAYNLGPYQLDRMGLSQTIEEMLQKVGSSSLVNFTVEIDELGGVFPRQAEISIFRIVQEAINNIVKHSGATEAQISVKQDTTQVVLTIHDDGQGFLVDEEKTNGAGRRRGLGLQGMVERVRILRGDWTIDSAPGKGTRINIELPRPRSPAGH